MLCDGQSVADAAKYKIHLVTAAVDRLDVLKPLAREDGTVPNMRISGHVSSTTSSTLEVFLRLSTLPVAGSGEKAETILLGRFTMAARKSSGGKHLIPELLVEGEVEEELLKIGNDIRHTKRARGNVSLAKTPPTEQEGRILHNIFVGRSALYERGAILPSSVTFMRDTAIQTSALMHPQDRNVHSKIFGGCECLTRLPSLRAIC